jgi:hypothetical protein
MIQIHDPQPGVSYKMIARQDGAFEIEVAAPGRGVLVASACLPKWEEAERWIAGHLNAIAATGAAG